MTVTAKSLRNELPYKCRPVEEVGKGGRVKTRSPPSANGEQNNEILPNKVR